MRRPQTLFLAMILVWERWLGAGLVLALVGGTEAVAAEFDSARSGVTLEFTGTAPEGREAVARRWLDKAEDAIAVYFGEFPLRKATVRVNWTGGRRSGHGEAFGRRGALVKINLGREATDEDLADDWELTHELVHLTFPDLEERHHWLEEGLATYVEPIARARAGQLTPERVWRDMMDGMPKGEPMEGDRGLDFTHTWGRTYWGGALFALRADVEIRRRTQNRFGLEHALRAIRAAGGTIESSWSIDRVIEVGDGATGVPVLRELYDEMKGAPVVVDLPALWKSLGVVKQGRMVEFDDSAPLAGVRKSMTERQR